MVCRKGIVLAGDMGGTKTDLGLFEIAAGVLRPVKEARFENSLYGSPEDVIAEFLKSAREAGVTGEIAAASIGVACPVEGDSARLTNLDWTISAGRLKKRFKIKNVRLINDMVATAYGLAFLKKGDYITLQAGTAGREGNAVVIAPGTGLGEVIIFRGKDDSSAPSPSEGGHADFAPQSRREIELLVYLMERFGHVSYERVVSGPGLKNIYDFVTRDGGVSQAIKKRFEREDPSFVITDEARKKKGDRACREALEIFVSVLGAESGNLALKSLATGGVFVAGGIAPAIADTLKKSLFIKAFRDKGRFMGLLSKIPVHVLLNPRCALSGAANHARGMATGAGPKDETI
ncbi:MAG: glucokinase [Deltaproteobacteria bacterium]|nr:glucokinase [Deltaproteobacteria bacterium]